MDLIQRQMKNPINLTNLTNPNLNAIIVTRRDTGSGNAKSINLMKKRRTLMLPPRKAMISREHSVAPLSNLAMPGLVILLQITMSYMITIHLLNIIHFWGSFSWVLGASKLQSMVLAQSLLLCIHVPAPIQSNSGTVTISLPLMATYYPCIALINLVEKSKSNQVKLF